MSRGGGTESSAQRRLHGKLTRAPPPAHCRTPTLHNRLLCFSAKKIDSNLVCVEVCLSLYFFKMIETAPPPVIIVVIIVFVVVIRSSGSSINIFIINIIINNGILMYYYIHSNDTNLSAISVVIHNSPRWD